MKAKRLICAVLALVMLCALLTSCGEKNSSGDEVVLKWYIPLDKQDDISLVNEEVNKYTMEKLGVKIDMALIDDAVYKERMNMNMASGDSYDLCWIGYLNPYENAVDKGGILPLDELLESTPDLKKEIPDYMWEQCKTDGKIYVVPNMQINCSSTALTFKKELVDKYNFDLDSITKTEDIEPWLKVIKENEPQIIPFQTAWGISSFRSLDEKHSITGENVIGTIDDGDRVKVVNGKEYGDAYTKAKKLYDWWKKGYIRKDNATVMDESTDVKAGRFFCTQSVYKPGMDAENLSLYGYETVSKRVSKSYLSNGMAAGAALAIGRNSKHPEETIKFIELINTDKYLYNLICFGIEGKHYNKAGENRIELVENSGYNPSASWKFGNQFNAYLLPGQPDDAWEQTIALNEQAISTNTLGYRASETPAKIKNIKTKLDGVEKEFIAYRQGVVDPDTYWDEYMKKLEENGLQEYIDYMQKCYDEWFDSKK